MKHQEIEYRFLVNLEFFNKVKKKIKPMLIQQGYLYLKDKEHTRVRIITLPNKTQTAYITTKTGEKPSRTEYESEIDVDQAKILFNACQYKLTKERYLYQESGYNWEIDYFLKEKIVMAEIELKEINEPFPHPVWLGNNVTFEKKYSNITIAKKNGSKKGRK